MSYYRILLLIVLLSTTGTYALSQKPIVIPEEVKKKCPDIPLQDRVRLAVARFSNSTSGVNSKNIDNFSSMISNAMFEVDCFRMLSMVKDSLDNKDAYAVSEIKPQLVITGEITEYNHTLKETKVLISKKQAYIAHIGFILQIKDPVTRDILFSKSFNEEGSSENKSMEINIPKKLPKLGIPNPDNSNGTVSTSSKDAIDKAYFDALEKGILEAVTFIVNTRDKIYTITKSTTDPGGNKTTIAVQNATFPRLMEIEKTFKELSTVSKIDKSLTNNEGKLIVYHTGKPDDLINTLSGKLSNVLDITGFEGNTITIKIK